MAKDNRLQASLINILSESKRGTLKDDMMEFDDPGNSRSLGHTIKANAASACSHARDLITRYERICQRVAGQEGVLTTLSRSEVGFQAVRRILQMQGSKVIDEASQLLGVQFERPNHSLMGEIENELWNRFAVDPRQEQSEIEKDTGEGWAVAASNVQRGIDRMVKDLPEGNEESA